MSDRLPALAACILGMALASPSGAVAQALDQAALGRIGSTNGAAPSGAAIGQALKALRSGVSQSSVSGLGGGPISIDTIGRPPLNDFTAYNGAGLSTGTGDFTRDMGPSDMTRVAAPIPMATTGGPAPALSAGGSRTLNLGPSSSGSQSGAQSAAGASSGGIGSFLPAGAGAALGLGGSNR